MIRGCHSEPFGPERSEGAAFPSLPQGKLREESAFSFVGLKTKQISFDRLRTGFQPGRERRGFRMTSKGAFFNNLLKNGSAPPSSECIRIILAQGYLQAEPLERPFLSDIR